MPAPVRERFIVKLCAAPQYKSSDNESRVHACLNAVPASRIFYPGQQCSMPDTVHTRPTCAYSKVMHLLYSRLETINHFGACAADWYNRGDVFDADAVLQG
jgi:hypothetical protein